MEEQIENIAQAQAEEQRQSEMELPVFRVPDDVVDRALTSGGNDAHCIERIVAFFQKGPSNEDAAAFLEKEYGVGGKGVTIAGEKYAMWFDESGIRICPGNSTYISPSARTLRSRRSTPTTELRAGPLSGKPFSGCWRM